MNSTVNCLTVLRGMTFEAAISNAMSVLLRAEQLLAVTTDINSTAAYMYLNDKGIPFISKQLS